MAGHHIHHGSGYGKFGSSRPVQRKVEQDITFSMVAGMGSLVHHVQCDYFHWNLNSSI